MAGDPSDGGREYGGTPTPTGLRVDFEREPTNVDPTCTPRFSWRVTDPARGGEQSAYRVLVARDPETLARGEGDCWDSGVVESDRSTGVAYDGVDLRSNETYHWNVRIWDGGVASEFSEPGTFSTALATGAEWEGEWIGYQPGPGDTNGFRTRWQPATVDPDPEWVQIDLGAVREIHAIELHPTAPFDGPTTPDGVPVTPLYSHWEQEGALEQVDRAHGFGFPVAYRIEVADDEAFEDARVIADATDGRANPVKSPVVHDADARARFVRVSVTEPYELDTTAPPNTPGSPRQSGLVREEMGSWYTVALAALAVRDEAGTDLARDCPVSASSSVETQTWGRQQLVNGAYASTTAPGSPLLRQSVHLAKPVANARAHVATLGYGELYVNGERIGDAVLDPAWTQYDERVLYATHDVTDALSAGSNAVGLWLGRGRFSRGTRDWSGFGSPRAILQLEITYEDGTTRSVATDTAWLATESPIVENDIYDGETYDARRERDGWASPGYDPDGWIAASRMEPPGGDLTPQRIEPMRVLDRLEPESITARDGGYVLDFGQNLTGWLALSIEDPTAGEPIVLSHAEALDEDGELSTVDLRSADATDTYVPRGESTERYHPRFTYHGFRYARIEGYPGELSADDVRACMVATAMPDRGSFECSDEDLCHIQRNARWGLRGNAHGIPEDCPQRDERFGWTGDGHITAGAFQYNFDAVRFHRKWMDDHDDVQSDHGYVADTVPYGFGTMPGDPTWSITRVVIPWQLYRHARDPSVLERYYGGMCRYVDYWDDLADDHVIPDAYSYYGDWLAFENTDGRRGLPLDLFNTAFHYRTTRLVAHAAAVLGRDADAETYADRADAIADAFTDAFFDPDANTYGPGTQSSYAVPLFLDLVPGDRVDAVAAGLAEKVRDDGGKLRTGFLGTRPLLHALANNGYPELAYEVATQPERPGWVYMIRNGATTMWERWDADEKIGSGMNSLNHSPFTFVSEWFYAVLAGIAMPDDPATDRFDVSPTVVGDLEWVDASIETPDGEFASRWERTAHGLRLDVTVPWNNDARVRIPASGNADRVRLREGDTVVWDGDTAAALPDGVTGISLASGAIVVDVDAGRYRFALDRRD